MAAVAATAAAAWWYFHVPSEYFEAAQLDHTATPLRRIDLDYPPGREGVDYYGTLRMRVYIGHTGDVDRVEVTEATVPAAFRDNAVKAFGQARFEPATRRGRAVRSVKKVEVVFAPPVGGVGSLTSPSDR